MGVDRDFVTVVHAEIEPRWVLMQGMLRAGGPRSFPPPFSKRKTPFAAMTKRRAKEEYSARRGIYISTLLTLMSS